MLNRVKKLINSISEASMSQFLSSVDQKQIILDSIENNSFSMGDDFYNHLNYEIGDSTIVDILTELEEDPEELEKENNDTYSSYDFEEILEDYGDKVYETKAYKDFIYSEIEAIYDGVVGDLRYMVNHEGTAGNVELFRVVGIPDQPSFFKSSTLDIKESSKIELYLNHLSKEGKHLGIYWADSFERAYDFGNNNVYGELYIFKISIPENYINWRDTILLRMDLRLGDESEIRLFKNTKIKIVDIYNSETGDAIPLDSSIKDKIFYA